MSRTEAIRWVETFYPRADELMPGWRDEPDEVIRACAEACKRGLDKVVRQIFATQSGATP